MDFISSIPVQAGLFIISGLAIIAISLLTTSDFKRLDRYGIKTEGIIFKLEQELYSGASADYSGNLKDKVTVRFLTKEKVWITGKAKSQFLLSYTGQYMEGDKVMVKYDPEQPAVFMIETRQSETIGRIVVAITGLVLIIVGIYQSIFN
jgi:hypothetical protein